MKPLLDFDDAGAAASEPAKGVTVGDIREWHDEMERLRDLVREVIYAGQGDIRTDAGPAEILAETKWYDRAKEAIGMVPAARREGITNKIPCSCPKGGMYERADGSTYVCERCGGSEWIEATP